MVIKVNKMAKVKHRKERRKKTKFSSVYGMGPPFTHLRYDHIYWRNQPALYPCSYLLYTSAFSSVQEHYK